MGDHIKTYNLKQPSAGTNVHTSRGPSPIGNIAQDRAVDFFFRGTLPVETPGAGDMMKTPRSKRRR